MCHDIHANVLKVLFSDKKWNCGNVNISFIITLQVFGWDEWNKNENKEW